ncbi:MAG: hypothetical protein GXP54_07190 [Deltaproteobacteria bacterium]|nr:hypothetical protein [Deltaproteobacteria bacterium]
MPGLRYLVVAFVLLAWTPALHADLFNQRNHLVGGRAAMMGGAYTALAEDLSAAFYNPAGLPFIDGLGLTFSISGYSYQRYVMTELLGVNQDVVYNVRMSRFNPLPSTLALSYAPFEGRWVISIGAFEVDRLRFAAINNYHTTQYDDLGNPVSMDETLKINMDTSSYLIGLATGVRITDWCSVGFSIFYHLYQGLLDMRYLTQAADGGRAVVESANDVLSGGLVFAAGLRFNLYRYLWLGLAYRSETLHLNGDNTYAQEIQSNIGIDAKESGTVKGDVRLPHQLTLGLAWAEPGSYTLSFDAIFYLPMDYLAPNEIWNPGDINNRHREAFHFDASIGAEIELAEKWAIRLGFYTNTSGATDFNAEDRIHLFGGTLGFAYGRRGKRFGVGINVMGGRSGTQTSPGGDVPTRWDRLQVQIQIGGTTELLK